MKEDLIRRCQQGDRQAMGLLYTAMHDELLAVCRRYVADGSTAEDLLHDAFLLIFSKIGDLRSPEKANVWMSKVVKNVALLYVRKQHRLPTVPIDQLADDVGAAPTVCPSSSPSVCPPSNPVAGDYDSPPLAITYDELMSFIDTLPEGYRRVFRMSVLEGLSHTEIAALLNIEPHSSSSQLYRAKSILRKSLAVLLFSLLSVLIPLGIYRMASKKEMVADNDVGADPVSTRTDSNVCPPTPPVPPQSTIARTDTGGSPYGQVRAAVDDSTHIQADTIPQQPAIAQADTNVCLPTQTVPRQPAIAQADTSVCLPTQTVPRQPAITKEDTGITPYGGGRNAGHNYNLSLAYSSMPNGSPRSLPYGTDGINGEVDSVFHHRLPLTVAIDASYSLSPRLWLRGGLSYTLLSSEQQVGNTYMYYSAKQHVRYLGITLGSGYDLLRRGPLTVYGQASATLNLPLHSTRHTTYTVGQKDLQTEDIRLHPSTQWSIGTGLGVEYNITPSIGIFMEPGLQYHFGIGDGIKTWRTEHPTTFSLPIGVRIKF